MRRPVVLVGLLALLAVASAGAGEHDHCLSAVCPEWWQKDEVNLRRLPHLLDASALDVTGLEAAEARREIVEAGRYRDLGFGASHSEWHLPDGGYLSIQMQVVHFRGELARYRLRMSSSPWSRHRERVLAVWSLPAGTTIEDDRDGLVVNATVPAVEEAWRAELARELGPLAAARASGRIEAAYGLLMDPAEETVVGTTCGFAPTPTAGFEAGRRLVAEKRWDLIENVLRGPSAGGRIYAAAALRKHQADGFPLAPETQEVLRRIESLPLEILTCSGCIISSQTSAEALALLGGGE